MSYPPPPGQQPYPPMYQPPPASSGKATTSLVLGIVSLVFCGLFLGIPAMIVSRQAKREIRESGGRLGGDGLATAGFVTGLIGTIWSVISIILVVVVFVFGATWFNAHCSTVSDGNGGSTVNCDH